MKQRSGMPYDVVAIDSDELAKFWSLEEEGAFHRLMRHQWTNGSIPNDISKLAVLCRCVTINQMEHIWNTLKLSFPTIPGDPTRCQNPKTEKERAYVNGLSNAGKAGAEARWGKASGWGGIRPGSGRNKKNQDGNQVFQDENPLFQDEKNSASDLIETEDEKCDRIPIAMLPTPSQPIPTQLEDLNIVPDSKFAAAEKHAAAGNRPRDLAFDSFAEAFTKHRSLTQAGKMITAVYQESKGDFVQLQKIRKKYGTDNLAKLPGWDQAVENYFLSDCGKYTLADLCTRYDIFLAGPADRFGHSIKPARRKNEDLINRTKERLAKGVGK